VNQLHKVANEPHDRKANRHRSTNLEVFGLRWLCAPCHELLSFPHELLRNLNKFFDFVRHDEEGRLRELIVGRGEGAAKVERVVCLGLGSLMSARREGRRASWTQLVALRVAIEVLGISASNCIFQDPQFTDTDKEFLTSLGYTVVDDPQAFDSITESALVYAIHCYAPVYKSISERPRPAVLIGTDVDNFGKFNLSIEGTITQELEDMVSGCEVWEFPQTRHDFSDTKIYWRKGDVSMG